MKQTRLTHAALPVSDARPNEITGQAIVEQQSDHKALTVKAAFVILAVWGLILLPRVAWGPHYYMDSAPYVESARSIVSGQGFMHRSSRGLENKWTVPLTLWPPGYPLLVAATMMCGLSAPTAALVVPIASSFLCVLLIAHLFYRWLPPPVAITALLATMLMPVFAYAGGMALSETPCLALSLVSITCLFNWTENRNNQFAWLFLAGLACGVAWCIRNSSVGLFAASSVFVVAHILWLPLSRVLKALVAWCAGWTVASGWLVVRNFNEFGKLNPYHMPASDLTLWDNLRQTWHVLVADLTGSSTVADWLNNKYILAVAALLFASVIYLKLAKSTQLTCADACCRYRKELFLLLYFALTIATTAIARSVYKWGEWINSRHFYPVYWIAWLFVALAAWKISQRLRENPKAATVAAASAIFLLAVIQAGAYLQTLQDYRRGDVSFHNLHTTWQDERIVYAVSELIRKDQLVLTDSADYLRILGDVHARRFVRPGIDRQPELTLDDVQRAAEDGIFWGFVIWDREACESGKFGSMIQELLTTKDLPSNIERVVRDDSFPVILKVHPVSNRGGS